MKSIRNIAFSALLTLGAFSAMTYTSCDKDECKDVVCQNGGTCNAGACQCSAGYEGDLCQTKSADKFIGTWTAAETCGNNTSTYQVTITADPTAADRVLVKDLGDYGCTAGASITWNGTVNTATLTINDSDCGYQINATGTYNNGKINFTYTTSYVLNGVATTDNCTAVLSK